MRARRSAFELEPDPIPATGSGHPGKRTGMALVMTLLAIVVLGIAIGGVFFGSSQELRVGQNLLEQERAMALAEDGLAQVLADWEGSGAAAMATGSHTVRTVSSHEGATIRTTTTKLSHSSFWVVSETLAGPLHDVRRSTGVLVRLAIPDLGPAAAVSVRLSPSASDSPLVQGAVRITGADSNPGGWSSCVDPGLAVPGIVTNDTARIAPSACPTTGCIDGAPPVRHDSTVGDGLVPSVFDPDEWDALTSRANIIMAGGAVAAPIPVVLDGQCDRTIEHNWGDPSRTTPCASYFPVIHVSGDLRMSGGVGQGVLLVDGDLLMEGSARFVGVVLVRGALRTGTGGMQLMGLARVGGRSDRPSILGDGARVSFSRCAALSALAPNAHPVIVPRSWVQVH